MFPITTDSTTFRLHTGETLLEGLERTGHRVEYQCRSGYCGSCRLKISSGSVSYREPPLAYVAPDEILACCCRPDSPITVSCACRAEAGKQ